jgi:hypothetical protein
VFVQDVEIQFPALYSAAPIVDNKAFHIPAADFYSV